jgi:hypothetical protein
MAISRETVAALGVLLGGVACGEHEDPVVGQPPLAQIQVRIEPADLTSATGDVPITLWVDYGARPVPASALAALRSTIRFERYPDGASVPHDIEEQASVIPERDPVVQTENPYRGALHLKPASPLVAGWYRVSFDAGAAGVAAIESLNPRGSDGRHGSRFNPAHGPVLQSATHCSQAGKTSDKLLLRFSELLAAGATSALEAEMCSPIGSSDHPETMFGFACPSASPTTALLTLGAGLSGAAGHVAGILSSSGAVTPAPTKLEIDWTAAVQSEAHCRLWRP